MAKSTPPWTLGALESLLGGRLLNPELQDRPIHRPVPAGTADSEGITFAENPKYAQIAESVEIGAVLVPPGLEVGVAAIEVASPRMAFGWLLSQVQRDLPLQPGIHPSAVVHESARIDSSAQVGAYAVIEQNAVIEAHCRVYPFAYVGDSCWLKEGAKILPHAVLVQDVTVGERSVVFAGAVLGSDGFGFGWDGQRRVKVPQVGSIEIDKDVEIGANTAIDRATAGKTTIGQGTKIDNLVHIGHNAKIGEHGVIASQTGLSGSVTIGDRVVMGGQCGANAHIQIADDVTFGGRTGIAQSITSPGAYWGTPSLPHLEALRVASITKKLPELLDRIRKLERQLAEREES